MQLAEVLGDVLSTWLLGERGRMIVEQRPAVSLLYAGEVPTDPVLDPGRDTTPPPLDPGRLANITNIVVLMMENRSFDHMLGYLSLAGRADIDGVRREMSNPGGVTGTRHQVFEIREGDTQFPFDPGHDFASMQRQRGLVEFDLPWPLPDIQLGENEGFIFDFEQRLRRKYGMTRPNAAELAPLIMGFHGARNVPIYDALAREFAVCNRWFSSHPGHTWPNRFISLTGHLAPGPDGRPQLENPDPTVEFDPLEVATIFDHLDAAGVD